MICSGHIITITLADLVGGGGGGGGEHGYLVVTSEKMFELIIIKAPHINVAWPKSLIWPTVEMVQTKWADFTAEAQI